MASEIIDQYTQPHQFEPLLPQRRLEEFRQRTRAVVERSLRLSGSAHPATIASLRELVRGMNSYHSNRIEGQSTHPLNIERALRRDLSDQSEVARMQRLALAHIEAERTLEQSAVAGASALTSVFLQKAHAELYDRLSVEDHTSAEGRIVAPGAWRQEQVAVGRHEPPLWSSLPAFPARLDVAYGTEPTLDDLLLVSPPRITARPGCIHSSTATGARYDYKRMARSGA